MLLYHDPAAVNPRRVRIFAAEKGIHLDTIEVSIADRANLKPEFLAKNPLHLLPVLELEDGRILRESMAICHYLEELHPEPNLLGADALGARPGRDVEPARRARAPDPGSPRRSATCTSSGWDASRRFRRWARR